MKQCFLSKRVSDSLAVVVNDVGIPITLNYRINGAPSDGACPSESLTSGHSHHGQGHQHGHGHHGHSHSHSSTVSELAVFANTTVSVKRPQSVRLYALLILTPFGLKHSYHVNSLVHTAQR